MILWKQLKTTMDLLLRSSIAPQGDSRKREDLIVSRRRLVYAAFVARINIGSSLISNITIVLLTPMGIPLPQT